MIHIHHIQSLLISLLICCFCTITRAQSIKEITVSQGNSYTDHISLKEDTKDMDLMVKFVFNEATNTLSVSLISYRDLFVFQTDTPCKQAIKGRKIKPEKLPFVVNTAPGMKYQLTKEYWKAIPTPKSKHIFKKWIEYSGLHPIPTEYKMVNDYIQQDFTILNKADAVSLTLHDVMMMEQEASDKPKRVQYDVVWGKDLNIAYHIYIERNPCFGMEEEIAAAGKLQESIKAGYKNLYAHFGSGTVSNRESLDNFKEMKQLLLGQYPAKTEKSACPEIQSNWDKYNLYRDSISNMKCRIRSAASTYYSGGSKANGIGTKRSRGRLGTGEGMNAGFILTQARRIDSAVARWLVSKDRTERADLIKQCQEIIRMMKTTVAQKGINGSNQSNALNIYNQAVAYYHNTCK